MLELRTLVQFDHTVCNTPFSVNGTKQKNIYIFTEEIDLLLKPVFIPECT